MIIRQLVVIGSLLLAAVVLQTTVLSRLGLPGATPDLVVVTVVAVALALGPGPGALTGFLGGALLDIATPSDAIVGLASIVLVGVGLVVGVSLDRDEFNIWVTSLVAGAACGGRAVYVTGSRAIRCNARRAPLMDHRPHCMFATRSVAMPPIKFSKLT